QVGDELLDPGLAISLCWRGIGRLGGCSLIFDLRAERGSQNENAGESHGSELEQMHGGVPSLDEYAGASPRFPNGCAHAGKVPGQAAIVSIAYPPGIVENKPAADAAPDG